GQHVTCSFCFRASSANRARLSWAFKALPRAQRRPDVVSNQCSRGEPVTERRRTRLQLCRFGDSCQHSVSADSGFRQSWETGGWMAQQPKSLQEILSDDVRDLHALGYAQQLYREM